MPVAVVENRTLAEAATPAAGPGRLLIQVITPGWGSSGHYAPDVLEAAARDRVWPAGTHMYIDHPSESETYDRPERTVKDLAAVLTEDARWDATANGGAGALVAEARVFSQWRQPLADMAEAIGVSIRASAEGETGEAEGRRGRIITRLLVGESVDFVTHAGRGGKVLQVLEGARTPVLEARNVGQWVESRIHRDFTATTDEMFGDGRLTREERITLSAAIGDALAAFVDRVETDAPQLYTRDVWDQPPGAAKAATEAAVARGVAEATANDRREQLDALVKAAHGGKQVWAWVRDFDETTVWFDVDGGETPGTFQQGYTVIDDVATALAGDRIEVRARTTYVPVGESVRAAEGSALPGIGDRVTIDPGKLHDPNHTTGTVAEVGTTAYGLVMDGMSEMGIHHWYTADEFTVDTVSGAATERPKKRMSGMPMESASPETTPTTQVEVREAAPAAEPNPPAVEAGTTPPHKKEDPMGTIQVDEARYAGLEEKAALVPALEARAEQAEKRADDAEQRALQAEAATYARDFARTLVTKANGDLAEASVARIVRDATGQTLPLTEAGRLDTEAFTPVVEQARQDEETYLGQVAEASGIGTVRGVGPTTTQAPVSEADVDKAVARAFGRKEA